MNFFTMTMDTVKPDYLFHSGLMFMAIQNPVVVLMYIYDDDNIIFCSEPMHVCPFLGP